LARYGAEELRRRGQLGGRPKLPTFSEMRARSFNEIKLKGGMATGAKKKLKVSTPKRQPEPSRKLGPGSIHERDLVYGHCS
jgi:hypothetical protein